MSASSWVIGFATFIAVSFAARYGVELVLDTWWQADGLDPDARPPLNAGGEWLVGGAIGLGAGWLVTRLLGAD